MTKHLILSERQCPPSPAPEYLIEYCDTRAGPLVIEVISATGETQPAHTHPHYANRLKEHLFQQSQSTFKI